ncbi:MAG: phosphate acyltransferase PlsX [Phycisphaerales bacterium]|nr:phosphate acyltransferase PlsX [Phycisphaerales bacterium]|tara:strand:+ start:62818 stop:63834 length:1017 start_codon:yes stop_codon:yes gene_type:complete
MRIGIDVMGGDNAPQAILDGALSGLQFLDEGDQLVLFGDQKAIESWLEENNCSDPRIEFVWTTQEVAMDESPVEAVRTKTDSSLVKVCREASRKSEHGQLDVVISAGNTGAFVAAAQMHMRRLPAVARPGIAAVIPTFTGPVTFIDVGANIEPKPHHLMQYGVMGTVYANQVLGIESPRVGLMNVGGEEHKGTEDLKKARDMMRDCDAVNYIGYVEGRAVFDGAADVVVSDGVTGNVTLKLAEGLSSGIIKKLAAGALEVDPALAEQFKAIVKQLYKEYDYHEYGGAPLMGVNGICLICHGSSEARTIANAIGRARRFVMSGVNDAIQEILGSVEVEA